MGMDRSRAIIDQDHAACLCRDAVAVMLDQSPALDSGSIAATANKRLERDPTERVILATIRELRSKGNAVHFSLEGDLFRIRIAF